MRMVEMKVQIPLCSMKGIQKIDFQRKALYVKQIFGPSYDATALFSYYSHCSC